MTETAKGILYGVGVGPGDPELITLKALKALERCPVWAVPRTRQGNSLALSIASGAAGNEDKEILYLDALMTRDAAKRAEIYRQNAVKVARVLGQGRDVAMPNLGDVSLYSTFGYLQREVEALGFGVEVIPGVTSFCAAAAKLKLSLTEMDKPLHIIPAGEDCLEENLELSGTRVLMKSGKELPRVKNVLKEKGLWEKAAMAVKLGLPGEKLYPVMEDEALEHEDQPGYFTVILVKE